MNQLNNELIIGNLGEKVMNKNFFSKVVLAIAVITLSIISSMASAGPVKAIKEVGEAVFTKQGQKVATKTANQLGEQTNHLIGKYGDDALPLLKKTGQVGVDAFEKAGIQAPKLIKLHKKYGDEALWLMKDPKKLDLFLQHGDEAAELLIKHPGLAEKLITQLGKNSIPAMNQLSKKGVQQMGIAANSGVFTATGTGAELLTVITKYGDAGMDFIWRNKKALTYAITVGAFIKSPQGFIDGTKKLVIEPGIDAAKQLVVDPVATSVIPRINLNWIILFLLLIFFMPRLTKSVLTSWFIIKNRNEIIKKKTA
ncbi:MAG: hypothetical protein WAO12_10355 [Venatoribacter sp.]